MKIKNKIIIVLVSTILIISICLNMFGAINSSKRRQMHINHIFFDIKYAVTFIEQYFESPDDLFNIEYAGLRLAALDGLLKGNPKEFWPTGVYSFQTISDKLSADHVPDSIIVDRKVTADGEAYLLRLLDSLNVLLSRLSASDECTLENKNLSYKEINGAISQFISSFFG